MPARYIFWGIMLLLLLALVAGEFGYRGPLVLTPWIQWILFALLGWQVYGAAVTKT